MFPSASGLLCIKRLGERFRKQEKAVQDAASKEMIIVKGIMLKESNEFDNQEPQVVFSCSTLFIPNNTNKTKK